MKNPLERIEPGLRGEPGATDAAATAEPPTRPAGPHPGRDTSETVWGLVEARAASHPERMAVIDGHLEIDYRRLMDRAGAIAAELVARGVEPGSRVAVCMGRSWELVATLLGVMGAGCAYVPLDPAYPRERVRYMLEHSRAAGAVVDQEDRAVLCEGVAEIVRLQEVGERATERTRDALAGARPKAGDLAYVLYTSGSTGRPKGVAVEHRNIVAMSRSMGQLLGEEELAGMLGSASVCFDASVMEILGTLTLGGTVVLAANVLALLELPAADRVRTLTTVPTVMRTLLAAGPLPAGVRCVVFGGEVLSRALVDQLHALEPRPRVLNVYGPTEATVYTTVQEVPVGAGAITIGRLVPGSRGYILDEALEVLPAGEAGELYLAGDQLARGYLHDEELTRERFLELEPSGSIPEERLYKTGDLCRFRDDGEIEFLGRVDRQVKVRGFRVELEEIEAALEAMEGVEAAAVAVVEGTLGQNLLVGYVVGRGQGVTGQAIPGEAITGEAARAFLAERLPGYLVPQVVVRLEELPRLPNGKLDRDRLPRPEGLGDLAEPPGTGADGGSEGARGPGGSPGALTRHLAALSRGEGHQLLLSIVRGEIASMLHLGDPQEVPPDRSVLDLGLDSLTAVELSSRLAALLGLKLSPSVVLESLTPTALAHEVLDLVGSGRESAGTERSGAQEAPAGEARPRRGASDTLGSLQGKIQVCYPPFLAASAAAWSVDDKAKFVRALRRVVGGQGQDPHSKLVRTGSGHRGIVADVHTGQAREAIIWTTNLYLGMNRDPEVIEAAGAALEEFGTGMGTSAVAGGILDIHAEFERTIAELIGKPAACLFPTGYTANLGVVSGLLGADDVVVMDQLCHASVVDGARLSGAKIRTFRHNSSEDLEAVLQAEVSPYRTVLVVLESVYSMGEGAAPVEEIVRTAKRYGALVLVDEAHSFGFYGPQGAGLCAERGITDQVDLIMTTLSKALGSIGGVIAASEEHIDLLKSASRAFIFQASTSPADIMAGLTALRRVRDDDTLRERLWETTAYMRRRFTEAGYDLGTGDGPVIAPHFADKDQLFAIVNGLFARGVLTSAVTYPVVEVGRGRLRFICSASHTREDVDRTLEALIEAERESEQGRPAAREDAAGSHPGRSAVEAWARAFAAHWNGAQAATPGPTPNLTIALGLSEDEAPLTLGLHGGHLTVGEAEPGEIEAGESPFCALHLTTPRAASALCASDIDGILETVLEGTCALKGQVEPFIWLMARLVDWRRAGAAVAPGVGVGELVNEHRAGVLV